MKKGFLKTSGFIIILLFFAIFPLNTQTAEAGLFNTLFGLTGIGEALGYFLATLLMLPVMITSWLLWLSGVVLNLVLDFTVIDLSKNISGITGINIAWSVIRDISNMVFIFALLYIAIGTILGLSSVNWKKGLINVIIAALLINFSLFFTKVIFDASNLVALTFYERLNPTPGDIFSSGLSNSFMEPLGLTTFFSPLDGPDLYDKTKSVYSVAVVSFGGSIFFTVLSFVFLAISIMFIIRYVNIIFLLILSPIFFLGLVLPGIGAKMRQKWLESLTAQALFAPIFMILTWVVLTIIRSGGFIQGGSLTSGSNAANFTENFSQIAGGASSQGTFDLVMNFVIVIVFAVATLIISKQVADQGGSIGAKVVGGALGTTAWASRGTIGRVAKNISESDKLKEAASKNFIAKIALKSSQATAKGSLDLRGGLASAGGKLGFDSKDTDLGLGKAGGKGGYEAIHKEKVKKETEFADSLGPSAMAKAKAREELNEAKSIDTKDPRFQKEHQKEKRNREMELDDNYRRLDQLKKEYEARGASLNPRDKKNYEDEIKKWEEKTKASERAVKEVETVEQYKKARVSEAQSKVDRLEGVSPKEMEARMEREIGQIDKSAVEAADAFAKNLEAEVAQMEEELKKMVLPESIAEQENKLKDKKISLAQAQTDAKNEKAVYDQKVSQVKENYGGKIEKGIDGAEKVRKNTYADTISSRGGFGGNEIPFFRIPGRKTKLWRANVDAAAKIRKGDEKAEDLIKKALKKTGELKDDDSDKKEGGGESEGEGGKKEGETK